MLALLRRNVVARRVAERVRAVAERVREKLEDRLLALSTPRIPLPPRIAEKRVIVVGASVAKAWRLHLRFPRLRTLDLYQFDKSPSIARAIAARPDAILIKECAAYFPSDGVDPALVERWLDEIRRAGIVPMLATVVPVTAAHAASAPGRAPALWVFNDWLRELAEREAIPLLDLEAALRVSAEDRHLSERLADPDGLHLPRETYRDVLDALIPPLLLRAFPA